MFPNTKKALTQTKSIATFLLLMFLFGTSGLIIDTLHNSFGIPWLPFQKLFFVFIPALLIFHKKKYSSLSFRYLYIFLLLILTFYLMENFIYGERYSPEFSLIRQIAYVYVGFFLLINVSLERQVYLQILNSSLILILINTTLFYLSVFNITSMSGLHMSEAMNRLTGTINVNIFADLNVFGIYIFFILKKEKIPFKLFNVKISSWLIISYLIGLVFINATRGAILLFSFGLLIYIITQWHEIKRIKKVLFVLLLLLLLSYGLANNLGDKIVSQFYLFDRLINQTSAIEGRGMQIVVSLTNFLENPFIGVGFEKAASDNLSEGYTGSNFQYTQILASGGIVLAVLYFSFIFHLFGARPSIIRNNPIILSVLAYVLILLIFRQLNSYLAIAAYIVLYNKSLLFFQKRLSIRTQIKEAIDE